VRLGRSLAGSVAGGGPGAGAGHGGPTTAAESIGELDGAPVVRKKGPYGHYVAWKGQNVSCKETETLEELTPRLQAKVSGDVVDHTVGPYKIRKGPYGLYMFKPTASNRKPTFVSIPDGTQWATLTLESAEQMYKQSVTAKKEAKAPSKRSKNKETTS
jgi:topoisomerase IA-like protein